jgi:hypothetical protein
MCHGGNKRQGYARDLTIFFIFLSSYLLAVTSGCEIALYGLKIPKQVPFHQCLVSTAVESRPDPSTRQRLSLASNVALSHKLRATR